MSEAECLDAADGCTLFVDQTLGEGVNELRKMFEAEWLDEETEKLIGGYRG